MSNMDMNDVEERETELSEDKVYNLPKIRIIKYNNLNIAIATEIARWIILFNEIQTDILLDIMNGMSVGNVFEKYTDKQDDIINVLTQIEATHIETMKPKSIFSNTRLHLHLTNRCNLNCPHCYMRSGNAYSDELSTDEVKKLCHEFYKVGGTNVSLTGGEPTTRPDFFEIVEYISSLGMQVSIFSNGCFWDEKKVRRLADSNIDGVQISIDGYDETTNAIIRGKNVFTKALKSIDLFVKNNIYVKVAVSAPYEVLKRHQKEYIEFSNGLIEKYGNDAIEIDYSYFFMQGRNITREQIANTKEEYFNLVDGVVKGLYGDIAEDSFVSNILDGIYDSCGYGGLNVMANGDFYFCDRIPDINKAGNIRNISMKDIRQLMSIAERVGRIDNYRPCNDCELKYICGGGCRVEYFRNFAEIEDVTSVEFDKIGSRKCSIKDKEKYYDLMVRTYERFYC